MQAPSTAKLSRAACVTVDKAICKHRFQAVDYGADIMAPASRGSVAVPQYSQNKNQRQVTPTGAAYVADIYIFSFFLHLIFALNYPHSFIPTAFRSFAAINLIYPTSQPIAWSLRDHSGRTILSAFPFRSSYSITVQLLRCILSGIGIFTLHKYNNESYIDVLGLLLLL